MFSFDANGMGSVLPAPPGESEDARTRASGGGVGGGVVGGVLWVMERGGSREAVSD